MRWGWLKLNLLRPCSSVENAFALTNFAEETAWYRYIFCYIPVPSVSLKVLPTALGEELEPRLLGLPVIDL